MLCSGTASADPERPIKIVAAENVYGDIARQIGGSSVEVTSILSNPDQDPHLFEASPSVARAVAAARIVIYNGADYDPWMEKLLDASPDPTRRVIVAANFQHSAPGENPHVWYDTRTVEAVAGTLSIALQRLDLGGDTALKASFPQFLHSMREIHLKTISLRSRLAARPVTATEPVFGYMFDALGMTVRNQPFQLAVMNNTEPSASEVAAFEEDLKGHKVALLVYNSQASDPIAARMEKLARASSIPVVGAAETEPQGTTYQQWMMDELDAVDAALPK